MRGKRTLFGVVSLAAVFLCMGCDLVNVIDGTPSATTVNIPAIAGVVPPAAGGVPVKVITATAQYTGTVEWKPNHDRFTTSTVYTAVITLTAKADYTLDGVQADFFKVAGADSVTNAAGSGSVTAVFPKTAEPVPVITITTQPEASTTVTEGSITGSLTAEASVTGEAATLSYQWYEEGYGEIIGATGASFAIPTTLKEGTYYYFCEVSADGMSLKRSDVAAVIVKAVPVITITAQPQDTAVTVDNITGNLSFSAEVTEGGMFEFQWYENTSDSNTGGTVITGATESTFTIPAALGVGTYYYYCEVRADGAETKTTNAVTVAVNGTTVIVIQPMDNPDLIEQSAEAAAGTDTVFTVTGTGYTDYQWYVDGEIQDANGAAYTFNRPAGIYELMVVVTGGAGLKYSGSCRVTVGGK